MMIRIHGLIGWINCGRDQSQRFMKSSKQPTASVIRRISSLLSMMSYFGLILAFAMRYDDKNLGIGTLISMMIP